MGLTVVLSCRMETPDAAGGLPAASEEHGYCSFNSTDPPVVPPSEVAKLYVMFAGTGAIVPAIDLLLNLIPMM